jgi:hypothetical protein
MFNKKKLKMRFTLVKNYFQTNWKKKYAIILKEYKRCNRERSLKQSLIDLMLNIAKMVQ